MRTKTIFSTPRFAINSVLGNIGAPMRTYMDEENLDEVNVFETEACVEDVESWNQVYQVECVEPVRACQGSEQLG